VTVPAGHAVRRGSLSAVADATGVARALELAELGKPETTAADLAFAEFHRRGERRIGLGVDTRNETGATRLYERAGMQATYVAVIYEKSLR
jgi:hypothetical protein